MQFDNPLPGVPSVESPFFRQIFNADSTDPQTLRVARDLHEHGFAVFDFPDPEFERLGAEIRATLDDRFDWAFWRSEGQRRGISLRVQDAWRDNEAVRSLACNAGVIDLLSRLYGRRAWPFQTLNFPVGTQQHFHTDSVHFSSVPERFMCGVWVALEDIDEANGPLVYYPGSHRWPIYVNEHVGKNVTRMPKRPTQQLYEPMWRALVEAYGVKPQYFHARRGQALIWAANLLHGGAPHRDTARTRWSQVTHYFFEDCAYYTPMLSDPVYGRTDFRDLTNIATGQRMPQRYAGDDIPEAYISASLGQAQPQGLEGFDPQAYLAANPDVAAAGINPAEHYLTHGFKEKRRLRP
jgi:hypothetical protein